MNSEENHGFTSFDFITMMVSFVVIAIVTGPIIKKNIQLDQSGDLARLETSQLSHALIRPKNLLAMSQNNYNANRSVASINKNEQESPPDLESLKDHLKNGENEGLTTKLDPYGNPYRFAFLKNSKGQATHIVVWSDGPDRLSQTSAKDFNDRPENFKCQGDDYCTVTPIR